MMTIKAKLNGYHYPHSHSGVGGLMLPCVCVSVCDYQVMDTASAPIKVTTSQKYFILDFLRASVDVTL